MALIIRECTIAELEAASNIKELLEEYGNESSIKGLPHPYAKAEVYKTLERLGTIYVVGAWYNEVLIGFVIVFAPIMPHYSARVAVGESLFVAKEYRKTGAGLKLIAKAEEYAKRVKSCGLLLSAPLGGILAGVLPHIGYDETNRIFFKGFPNE